MFNSNGAMNATAVRIVLLIPVIGLILVVLWLGVIKIVDKIVLSKIADSTKQIEDDIEFTVWLFHAVFYLLNISSVKNDYSYIIVFIIQNKDD